MRDAKADFLATRENRADATGDPRVRSECSAFPASSRVIRYFTAHAIYGFEGRFSTRGAALAERKTRFARMSSVSSGPGALGVKERTTHAIANWAGVPESA